MQLKFSLALLSVVGVASANFRSGSVSTYEHFTYGKFVTRMKAPDRKGTVTSFFTYWDGPDFSPEHWNEIDIEIVPSVERNPLSMNMIYGDGHDKIESHDYAHGFHPLDEWHTYELEWTPTYVRWTVDGHEVRHSLHDDDPSVEHMNQAQSLRMNFWTPTFHSWGKDLDAHDMPWYALYDYVEVFEWDPHDEDFKFFWRDDFDSFDAGRWHKASGSFDANSCEFHPSNVYTEDGVLHLKMEPTHHHDGSHLGEHHTDHLVKHFPKQPLHAAHDHEHHVNKQVADDIEIPPVHDAFVDSHLYSKHENPEAHLTHHHHQWIDHHHGEHHLHDVRHYDDHHYYQHHPEHEHWDHHDHHDHDDHHDSEHHKEYYHHYASHDDDDSDHSSDHSDHWDHSDDHSDHSDHWDHSDDHSDHDSDHEHHVVTHHVHHVVEHVVDHPDDHHHVDEHSYYDHHYVSGEEPHDEEFDWKTHEPVTLTHMYHHDHEHHSSPHHYAHLDEEEPHGDHHDYYYYDEHHHYDEEPHIEEHHHYVEPHAHEHLLTYEEFVRSRHGHDEGEHWEGEHYHDDHEWHQTRRGHSAEEQAWHEDH